MKQRTYAPLNFVDQQPPNIGAAWRICDNTNTINNMADVYIKPEIKPDPDAPGASPAAFSEDDIYEDAGDLEFNADTDFQNVILAKVPKYVWEAWSKLDDDAEIQIGTIRVMQSVDHRTNLPKARSDMPTRWRTY